MGYYRPLNLSRSLALLANHDLIIVAGATDLYPALANRNAWGDWRQDSRLDISGLGELRGITDGGNHYRLGALTTWSDLVVAPLPGYFDVLREIAVSVGGKQIQNRATIAGNICNASPAADGIPGLLCLDAEVELCSQSSKRTMPLEKFIQGNRETAIRADELVTALLIPKLGQTASSGFEKLGSRRYLVISTVMVAGVLDVDQSGYVRDVRIAIGACSPVAQRMRQLENVLMGEKCSTGLVETVTMDYLKTLSPIDDVRADADFRYQSALELSRRLLARLMAQATPNPNSDSGENQ